MGDSLSLKLDSDPGLRTLDKYIDYRLQVLKFGLRLAINNKREFKPYHKFKLD